MNMKSPIQTQNISPKKNRFFLDFSKASVEAIESILDALNAEVDEAVVQKRVPLLENAYRRLAPVSSTVN